jgi:hypothetical protein
VADESDLAAYAQAPFPQPVLRYNKQQQGMEDIHAEIPAMVQRWRERLAPTELSVDVGYDAYRQALEWKLAAPAGASFAVLSNGTATAVPGQGQLRMDKQPQGCFRVRVTHADGRLSYSPVLAWPAASGLAHTAPAQGAAVARTRWVGPGDLFKDAPTAPCAALTGRSSPAA